MVTLSEIWKKGQFWNHEKARQWCVDRGLEEYSELTEEVMAYIERLEQRIEEAETLLKEIADDKHSDIRKSLYQRIMKRWATDQQAALTGKGTR